MRREKCAREGQKRGQVDDRKERREWIEYGKGKLEVEEGKMRKEGS